MIVDSIIKRDVPVSSAIRTSEKQIEERKKIMKKSIRFLCALLVIAMIACAAVSCTKTPDNPDSSKTNDGSASAEPGTNNTPGGSDSATETEKVTDQYDAIGISKDLKFNGATYTIYSWSEQTMWEYVGEGYDSSDLLQQAIYDRQKLTEELLGVEIEIKGEAGSWDHRNAFIQKLKTSVDNQDHAYDLVGQYTAAAAIGAMAGLYMPLGNTKYFNADHAWWPGDIVESCSINHNLYFVTGSITPTLVRNINAILYNLTLAESLNLPDVYQLVDNKQWTFDKFHEIIVGANADGNADGSKTYSFTMPNNVVYDFFFYGGGFRFVDVDKTSGTLSISSTLEGQPMVDWFEKWQSFLNNNDDVAILAINDGTSGFTVEGSLAHMGSLADVQNYLRDVDFDFAIFPTPTRNEGDNYHTGLGMWVTYYSIPRDAKDPDMSSAVFETMGYYGYTSLTPTFYKEAFQLRYLETEKNAKILDLLHETLTYDTGKMFADDLGIFSLFRQAANDSTSWTQIYAQRKVWANKLNNIVKKLG